jgi:hypothetical protein
MNNQSIIIIGNGQSILNNRFQAEIDAFDIVVRINNYKIKGYEHYLGKKTDIWFNGANSKLVHPEHIPNKVIVAIPSIIFLRQKNNIQTYISKRVGINSDKIAIIPEEQIESYEKIVNHNRLTTGLYSILWAINNYDKIYIHGFDFFINSKAHYYDSKLMTFVNNNIVSKGHKHDNDKEYNFIKKLLDENRIKKLKND